MAGYSGTPLPKKFGMKPAAALRGAQPTAGFLHATRDLPATRFIDGDEDAQAVMVVLVVTDRARLDRVLPDAIARLATPAGAGSRGRNAPPEWRRISMNPTSPTSASPAARPKQAPRHR